MTLIRAANLLRIYGSGSTDAAGSVVGLPNDPVVIANATTSRGIAPVTAVAWGWYVPIQWEVKNDDLAAFLQCTFDPRGFVDSFVDSNSVTITDNWINLAPGQAFTMQKRHYEQEYAATGAIDLIRMYARGAGSTVCAFSATIDLWVPNYGA
jgi:hypothetical protein